MARKSQKMLLAECLAASLDMIRVLNPEGISVPFIEINIQCGRIDRITEYFRKYLATTEKGREFNEAIHYKETQ